MVRVYLPSAEDLDTLSIRPTLELHNSTSDIDDFEVLNERYEREGYLFFRGLVDTEAVLRARRRMVAVLQEHGLAEPDGESVRWVGGDAKPLPENSPAWSGIYKELSEDSSFKRAFDKILGEPAVMVPMTIYRAYPPSMPPAGAHQDGFFSPGIHGYRSFWIPLVAMNSSIGGLALAPRMNNRGYLHNTAKRPRSPIPAGIIPEDNWASIDYEVGDLLVIHHLTPHVGLPNRSDEMRVSIDLRVQSAARPNTVMGHVVDFDLGSVTLRDADGVDLRLTLDNDTFIRIVNIVEKMSPAEFVDAAEMGMHLMATRDGDKALMLRHSQEG